MKTFLSTHLWFIDNYCRESLFNAKWHRLHFIRYDGWWAGNKYSTDLWFNRFTYYIALSVYLVGCICIFSVCSSTILTTFMYACVRACVCIHPSISCLLSLSVFICVYIVFLSVYFFVCLSSCLSFYPSISLSVFLGVCPSVFLSVCRSINRSIWSACLSVQKANSLDPTPLCIGIGLSWSNE